MNATLFKVARIHTLAEKTDADAILVRNGRIDAIGRIDELLRSADKIVDLGGATVTPGLTDAHIHVTEWSVARTGIDLAHAVSIEEAARALKGAKATSGWITGRGWNPHAWGGAYPDRSALDAVVADVPVALQSHDMHAMWLNSRALQMAGIDESTADPDGGRVIRREDGQPSGVLVENAAQFVVPYLPTYDARSIVPLIIDAQAELHSMGITGVHSFPGVYMRNPDPMVVLQQMLLDEQLTLRVLQHIPVENLDAAIATGWRSGDGNEWIRNGAVKMFLDGALGSRSAWMVQPYEGSTDRGVQVLPEKDFKEFTRKAADAGISATVHAIGDAAVGLAMDVLGAPDVQVAGYRHRIEHVQCLPEDWRDRFNAEVICSVQPSHMMTDWRAADRHWGERGRRTYAFRSLLDAGATLLCGSDAPVEAADPRHGLYAAVTRKDLNAEPAEGWYSEQRLRLAEVLRGYTQPLTVGSLADFVAWRQDPFEVEHNSLPGLLPAATVVDGSIVYGG